MELNAIQASLREARTNRDRLFGELENLRARAAADGENAGLEERIGNVNRGIEAADTRIQELEADYGRRSYLESQADRPEARMAGSAPAEEKRVHRHVNENREKAFRTIEHHQDAFDDGAAARTEKLVRQQDPRDWTARYIAAVGSDAYRSAFGKLVSDPQHGHLRFGPEEVEIVRVVSALEQERALTVGTGSQGGFALPLTLDPSILLTSNGSLNPIRQLARNITVSTNIWGGVSSGGVTVAYSAEAAAMTDNSPTLAQPVITARRWTAYVPYSWELGADWPGVEDELVRLIADGRDVNDSTHFYSGTSSSNQPQGIATSLGTTQQVLTVGTLRSRPATCGR